MGLNQGNPKNTKKIHGYRMIERRSEKIPGKMCGLIQYFKSSFSDPKILAVV
jgi:hypothetical protein